MSEEEIEKELVSLIEQVLREIEEEDGVEHLIH